MLLQILGMVEIILFAWGILQMEFTAKRSNYLWAILILAGGELFYHLCPSENMAFLVGRLLGHMLGAVCLFGGAIGKRIVVYWFSLFYVTVIYLPIQFIAGIIAWKADISLPAAAGQYFMSLLACLLVIVIALQIKKRNSWAAWIRSIPAGYFALGIICGFGVQGMNGMVIEMSADQSKRVQIFVWVMQMIVELFLYGLGIAVVFSDLLRQQYKRESELKDKYLRISKSHYEELAGHMREVRSIRHDFKAHMNVLEAYIEKQEWEQAKAYLQQMQEHQKYQNEIQIRVGNELVNAVLTDGMRSCGRDIELVCKGVLPGSLCLSDYDLCTIFSNLLSNSVEACKKLRKKEKRIVLEIKTFQDNLMILMENPIEWDVSVERLGGYTSKEKKEGHGYGIYNIKKTVESYGGEVEFSARDGMFQVRILLYQAIGGER